MPHDDLGDGMKLRPSQGNRRVDNERETLGCQPGFFARPWTGIKCGPATRLTVLQTKGPTAKCGRPFPLPAG